MFHARVINVVFRTRYTKHFIKSVVHISLLLTDHSTLSFSHSDKPNRAPASLANPRYSDIQDKNFLVVIPKE